jgi:hypothetical protein
MTQWHNSVGSVDEILNSLWTSNNIAINLREEFNQVVLGCRGDPGIGQFMVLRSLSRSGIRCPCWDETRGSSSNCKYCKGESLSWTEKWVRGHFTQTYGRSLVAASQTLDLKVEGIFNLDKALIYLPFDAEPAIGDSLFRIKITVDGKPYYPIERIEKWRAVHVEDRRQEGGIVAFWLVLCERVDF